jgi:hypothetical protein
MNNHVKVRQFWLSESGMLQRGLKEHGDFVVCSCGAEICAGPSSPYDVPKPARLEELQNKDQLSPVEEAEAERLWEKWNKEWRAKLAKSTEIDHENMRKALDKHAREAV